MSEHERHLELFLAILTGEGGGRKIDNGVVGGSAYETAQMRAELAIQIAPRTASMIGVEWDGVKRLEKGKK